ncbi:mechanosensitive ion channel protein MscS [Cupriavidus plantarum]|uniref:Uncharacterized protein n=1 Tax=Cupriavidus plantarum TaxID=942865 RepID=A0A316ETR8_9BURK|nr:mechanosensitive ion channel protein MscS [Cupriavidus plantarum]NYI00555.1 hypothetical protein [Cupriavidus plantarum]PWK34965.1 hypothetical protein C7419_102238 [Cupriavidus plantarum]RLK38838.1 hypothetical protein C7417_2360 [Cupriavidus plantarum]CAG2136942.1 hypothetical protein LMG26296_02456 [Cupriavidus plantarum]SMR84831.1 hypothetical protein SAMN05421735_3626 [Cupriavidus plantarum]
MRKSIRYTGIALLSAALLAAGPASARDYGRDRGHYHGGHGGGGGNGVALAIGAIAGLALGAAVLSSTTAVAAPAPVYAPPQPVGYVEQGYVEQGYTSYQQPYPQQQVQPYSQVPPGYCYRSSDRAYVPCAQPAQVNYYGY